MLYKTPGLLEKLEQPIFLGGRESVSHRRGLAHKRSEGWDASSRLLFCCGCGSIEHASYPHPKTTRRTIMPSRVEPKILLGGRYMDLFNLISAHEVPLLTVTANHMIDMGDAAATLESSGMPSTIEKSPLNFANEDPPQTITERGRTEDQGQDRLSREIPLVDNPMPAEVAPDLGKEMAAIGPTVNKRRRKGGKEDTGANAPRKVLMRDHDTSRLTQSTLRGKSLAAMGLKTGSTFSAPASQETPTDVSDPDPLSFAKPQSSSEVPTGHMATTEVQDLFSTESPELGKSASYQLGWGVINSCRLDTPDACQDVVDHIAVEVEVHDLRIRTKNLETLLEAEVDMKKAAKAKYTELIKELKSLRVQFSDLQVNNDQLS
ncbi:hypothetical protein Tco_1395875 [Tanacetum coccineum]